MTTKSENQELLNALVELREHVIKFKNNSGYRHDNFNPFVGICSNARINNNVDEYTIDSLMERWPDRAESCVYTVPASRTDKLAISAKAIYNRANENMLWREGEYAELRMELLNWMIEELNK